jgi:hypothetical protein
LAALGIGGPVKAVKEKIDEPISQENKSSEKSTNKPDWSEAKEKIKALGELLEKGLISQEEYNEKKENFWNNFNNRSQRS